MADSTMFGGLSGFGSGISSYNPYTQQLQPSLQQGMPSDSPYLEAPPQTADDRLGPGNTAPQTPTPSTEILGMGGSVTPQRLPARTVQQPVSQQQLVTRPPMSSGAAQGNITAPQTGPMVSGRTGGDLVEAPLRSDLLMPGGWQRRPETRTGGIMTQSHPDFIGRVSSDQSGGVRPGAMPQMSAVAAARAAQQASFNRGPQQ